MALTATATPMYARFVCGGFLVLTDFSVQRDIIYSLKMDKDNLFYALHPFNRDNLFYEVSLNWAAL